MPPKKAAGASKAPRAKKISKSAVSPDEEQPSPATVSSGASPSKSARPRVPKRASSGKSIPASSSAPSASQRSNNAASSRAKAPARPRSPSVDSDGAPIFKSSPSKLKLTQSERERLNRELRGEADEDGTDLDVEMSGEMKAWRQSKGKEKGKATSKGKGKGKATQEEEQNGTSAGHSDKEDSKTEAERPAKKRKVGRPPKAAINGKTAKTSSGPPASFSPESSLSPPAVLASLLSVRTSSPLPHNDPSPLRDSDTDSDMPDISDMFKRPERATTMMSESASASPSKAPVLSPGKRDPKLRDGEHVYYLERGDYWPGRITAFVPAGSRPNVRSDRYEIEMIGHRGMKPGPMHRLKKREHVIAKTDRAIATCRLGKFQITVAPSSHNATSTSAATSSDALTGDAFAALSYQDQIKSVRPHLQRVIKDEYPPCFEYVDAIYARQAEIQVVRGDLDEEKDIQPVFLPELQSWLLHGRETDGSEVARPVGSERYESLTEHEKDQFIMDVLISEAVRAIATRINELGSKSKEELIADLSVFDLADEDLEIARTSSLEELQRYLADCLLNEQAAIKNQLGGAVISDLREARTRMRKELDVGEETDEVEKRKLNDQEEVTYNNRGRPTRAVKATEKSPVRRKN